MEIIHCKLPIEALKEYGRKIGETVKPDMDAGRYDHVGSWLLCFKMVDELGEMSVLSKRGYSEIVGSFSLMTRWINYSRIARCMLAAVEFWLKPQAQVVFDDYYLKTPLEEYPMRIHEDLSVFATWVIINGADSASIRREIPSRVVTQMRKITKKVGADGIICMFWRSLVAWLALTEKAIDPAYRASFKHGAKEGVKFGQLQSAFDGLRKSA